MMMMNSCGVQQNSEMRRNTVVSDRRDAVLSPQPHRDDVLDHHHLDRTLRQQFNHQMELCESNSRSEILDFILANGGDCEQDPTRKMTSSPPLFFSGSPPSRVSNPLPKDPLFQNWNELLVVAPPPPSTPRATKPPSPSSPRNGASCVRVTTNFGNNPPVRVVGFNCIDRGRRSSVPTLA